MVTALILIKIDYGLKVKEIIIGVNTNLKGYSEYLGQRDLRVKRVRPI
jgi:hypothetical protein